jgi:methionyl-tRNA formyltransferase
MVPALLAGIAEDRLTPRPQDHAKATVMPRRTKEDEIVHFDRPVAEAHRLIRALAKPYPGAVLTLPGQEPRRCARALPFNTVPRGSWIGIPFADGMLKVVFREEC